MTGPLIDYLTICAASALGGWAIGHVSAARRLLRQRRTEKAHASRTLESLNSIADLVVSDLRSHKRSVSNIVTALSASGDGAQGVADALKRLLEVNQEMEERILSAETKLEEQTKQLAAKSQEAQTDSLTQLVNRRSFREELERRYQESQRTQRPLSVLLMDIDHFKQFNDKHGHQVGDEVLRSVASTLHQTVRSMDIVARYGGEEFGVVLPNTPVVVAVAVAERLREAIERLEVRYDSQVYRVTVSVGAAELRSSDHVSVLLRRADEALYAAKAAGRNCTHWDNGRSILPASDSGAAALTEMPTVSRPRAIRSTSTTPRNASVASQMPETKPLPPDTSQQEDICSWSAVWHSVRSRLAEWKRGGGPFSVALVGLDGKEPLRQCHGEAAYETVRAAVGRQIVAAVREMDLVAVRPDDCFALLCPRLTRSQVPLVANRLAGFLADVVVTGQDQKIAVTVSIGWAEAAEGDDADRLLDRARAAMEAAQAAGGDRSYLHNEHWPEPLQVEQVIGSL